MPPCPVATPIEVHTERQDEIGRLTALYSVICVRHGLRTRGCATGKLLSTLSGLVHTYRPEHTRMCSMPSFLTVFNLPQWRMRVTPQLWIGGAHA